MAFSPSKTKHRPIDTTTYTRTKFQAIVHSNAPGAVFLWCGHLWKCEDMMDPSGAKMTTMGTQTMRKPQASGSTPPRVIICRQ
jgi:hypothetical protein